MMDVGREVEIRNTRWSLWLNKWFYWLLAAGIITNASGLFLPVMEPDGCLYALISKTMVLSGDFINLKVEGKDWLDKPHFPFWIVALSFKLFGIHGFTYKLPAFIFWIMGARYVFLFTKKLYNITTGKLAVLIYISVEHLIISNNDVRADPYLTGLMIASAYYYYRVYQEGKWIFVIYGSLFLAAAVMTKGIFITGLVAAGFMAEWIIKKKWREFTNPRWWLAGFLLFIFIIPELYCLYVQFDLHPEKLVYGHTDVSGIRFFFWDSQFGRFLNTGPIRGEGNFSFYIHTLLWAFLPWPVFALLALIFGMKKKNMHRRDDMDYVCPAVFIGGFLLFSFSKFQLPHYLNILYPFLSVMVANYLIPLHNELQKKIIYNAQQILYFLVFIFCVALSFAGGIQPVWIVFFSLMILAVVIYLLFSGRELQPIIGRSFLSILVANLFLNSLFYPVLFKYQSGMMAANFLKETNEKARVYTLTEPIPEFAFEFYMSLPIRYLKKENLDSLKKTILVFAPKAAFDSLRSSGLLVVERKSFPHFHVSQINLAFINSSTRPQELDSSILATVSGASR
jgi:4-amino-4-deoxy-L-arabinose transferase-like glycosyltransferase